MGKHKVKKKCCRSEPRCKRCPVTALAEQRRKAIKKAERAARGKPKKAD
ncbi:hypothetical protein [Saccharothrix algeriensis]|uniref:Uncharacterized protein n=1 Tax=Saccharothrix algeriensis TaxID=173560 RepID=A0ABS2S5C0_9PSEU|nr:hypothetical protein [Saccharothrix algeriensis]MBM7811430.1 hypothetical protein [Saccharothrix algeriensis]